LFLEAAYHITSAGPGSFTDAQAEELEKMAFDWILNGLYKVDDVYSTLIDLRERTMLAAAHIVGRLSTVRLYNLTERFQREMSARIKAPDASPQRLELYNLCQGMRFIQLSDATTEQLAASKFFLDRMYPLKYVAPDKKSRLQQAVCEMLTSILQPLADKRDADTFGANCDPAARKEWQTQVAATRTGLLSWSKQAKQVPFAFPAVAVLTCLELQANLVSAIDSLIDQLHKQLKERKQASMSTLCLTRCMACGLRRCSAQMDHARLRGWVDRAVSPVIQAMAKGGLQAPEHQELLRQLIVVVADYLPEYAVGDMVLELLQNGDSSNWESAMTGIASLLSILMMVPSRLSNSALQPQENIDLPATVTLLERNGLNIWVPPAEASKELLELLRVGLKPLELLEVGALAPKITAALSRIIVQCHNLYGYASTTAATKSYSDPTARERLGALPVFVMAIQCVPYVMPDHWLDVETIADDLATYTMNSESSMRKVSQTVLRRCMRAMPNLRDALIGSLVTVTLRVQEELTDIIGDSLTLILSLMRDWLSLGPEGTFTSLSRTEGVGIGLLCSASVEIRKLALELLRAARDVQRMLLTTPNSYKITKGQDEDGDVIGFLPGLYNPQITTTVADIIDSKGNAIIQRCYWDFGRWSDLARDWRPLPSDAVTFEEVLSKRRTNDDILRWARVLCELNKEVWAACENSAVIAHSEIAAKLHLLVSVDSVGRSVLPHDNKLEYARSYSLVFAAAPRIEMGQIGQDALLTTKEFVTVHVNDARSGIESSQQMAALALGNMSSACQAIAVQKIAKIAEEFADKPQRGSIGMPSVPGMGRGQKARKEDARLTQANIYRVLSSNLGAEILLTAAGMREKLRNFIIDTMKYISTTTDVSPELQYLRYCLCAVVRAVSAQLSKKLPDAFAPNFRKSLFEHLSLYCEDSQPPGLYQSELRRSVAAARLRIKDAETGRVMESDVSDHSQMLEHAASLAMASLLLGPLFSPDVRSPTGKVFAWIDRLLTSECSQSRFAIMGPSKDNVARLALGNLLRSNCDLASEYVDHAYSSVVSYSYISVLADVYSEMPLPLEEHVIVGLVLNKLVDLLPEVREMARHLLQVLSRRVWMRETQYSELDDGNKAMGELTVVIGVLSESQASYQMHLSARLAREHPEVGNSLAIEMLNRRVPEALLCLCPWLEHINLGAKWEGEWAETFLASLYDLTASKEQLEAVQRLWAVLATNRRNVVPTIDFLLVKGLEEPNLSEVGKQVVLHLSKVAAKQVVDHLAYEIQQQLAEADDGGDGSLSPSQSSDARLIQEFHNSASNIWNEQQQQQEEQKGHHHQRASSTFSVADSPISPGFSSSFSSGTIQSQKDIGDRLWGQHPAAFASITKPSKAANISAQKSSTTTAATSVRMVARSHVALSLLTELACELDEELRPHLPVVLHVAVVNSDNDNPSVRQECTRIMIYLLYSLACKHLEAQGDINGPLYAKVSAVISYLQSLEGRQLWEKEQATLTTPFVQSAGLVRSFVQTIAECFCYDADLKEKWAAEALKWSCSANSRHLASRSHQAFCALRPALNSTSCTAMLAALHKCLRSPNAESLDTAVEILVTLKTLLRNLTSSKLVLYPQLFLACLSLFNSSVVRIGELAMEIMLRLLYDLDLNDVITQQMILSTLPAEASSKDNGQQQQWNNGVERYDVETMTTWSLAEHLFRGKSPISFGQGLVASRHNGDEDLEEDVDNNAGQWLCLQQLLIKGLFQPSTEQLALESLAAVALQVSACSPVFDNNIKQQQQQQRESPLHVVGGKINTTTTVQTFSTSTLMQELLTPVASASLSSGGGGDEASSSAARHHNRQQKRGMETIAGSTKVGLALSLSAALPWLVLHLESPQTAQSAAFFLKSMSGACRSVGWDTSSRALHSLTGLAGVTLSSTFSINEATGEYVYSAHWMNSICSALVADLFPEYGRLMLQRLTEVIRRCSTKQQGAALAVLKSLFSMPHCNVGNSSSRSSSWFAVDSKELMKLCSPLLGGPLGPETLGLFEAMMRFHQGDDDGEEEEYYSDNGDTDEEKEVLSWPYCMDDLGECNKLCAEALARVVGACPGASSLRSSRSLSAGDQLLPFLTSNSNP